MNSSPKLACHRRTLGSQYLEHLARIHTFDWSDSDLDAFDKPALGTQAIEWRLNHWERVWEEDANEDIPLMRLAMSWLRRNMPSIEHISVVHGDYFSIARLVDSASVALLP